VTAPGEKLPLLVSVPHAGLLIPPEVEDCCVLTPADIERDGDEGAAAIFDLSSEVEAFLSTDVARAIVDLNRAEDDRWRDGVVKTHTVQGVDVYDPFPPEAVVDRLIERYHRPYHRRLTDLAGTGVRMGLDCHTMLAVGPPVGPDPGRERPSVCLSNGDGTCPDGWFRMLHACFERAFQPFPVTMNDPFTGGYITRSHAAELPWVQVEISRRPDRTHAEKRDRVLQALTDWCAATAP
jgi:formiminoglutamase